MEAGAASEAEQYELAPQLGRLLRDLHAADVPGLPVDVVRRADMGFRVPKTREELAAVALLWAAPLSADALLDRAERLPPAAPSATCHGDLHFRQLLGTDHAGDHLHAAGFMNGRHTDIQKAHRAPSSGEINGPST